MPNTIQIAIIGCGWAGRHHAQGCAQIGAQVRWLVDVDEGRAASLQSSHPASRIATDYSAALADPDLDAVSICLPHYLHAPVAIDAAPAGKHVLVEKPLASTLDEADAMIAAAERSGVILMVAENVRYEPRFLKIRELIDEGVIGEPAVIQMTRECYLRRSFLEDRRWFLNARAAAGGIMMSGGIHDFETMRMLVGEIESVHALRARQRFLEMEGDDTSVAMVRFQNGAVGVAVESFIMKSLTTASGSEVHTLRIDGDLGSLWVMDATTRCLYSELDDLLGEAPTEHHIHVARQDTFTLLLSEFFHAILVDEEPITSGRSQRRALEVVLGAYRSMETGQRVVLDLSA